MSAKVKFLCDNCLKKLEGQCTAHKRFIEISKGKVVSSLLSSCNTAMYNLYFFFLKICVFAFKRRGDLRHELFVTWTLNVIIIFVILVKGRRCYYWLWCLRNKSLHKISVIIRYLPIHAVLNHNVCLLILCRMSPLKGDRSV